MPSLAVPADGPDTALDRRTQEAILRAAAAAQSPGTRRAYDSAWARFERWCATHQHRPLPARPDVVAAYLVRGAAEKKRAGRNEAQCEHDLGARNGLRSRLTRSLRG